MCNSIFQQKLQTADSRCPDSGPRRPKRSGSRIVIRTFSALLVILLLALPLAEVMAGFPYKRVGSKSRIEGPVVPAPKNWGYRPTRWVRWETDIIHPALGPIAPDAKKEVKIPGLDQAGEAETDAQRDTSNSKGAEVAPSPSSGSEMLPPLPLDEGPASAVPNLDEDLPPLPGEDFNPPATDAPPNTRETQPENTGPAGTPSFRDPDAIFDKPDGLPKADAAGSSPDVLPPLPKTNSPVKDRKPSPPPSAPAKPQPATPPPARNELPAPTPSIETPKPPPAAPSDPESSQWEKRTREKPIDPEALEKAAPKKKPGEPFYDPDSIFDERTGRRIGPAEVQWQKAGTAQQQTSERENGTDLTNAGTRLRQMPVFSPIKRTRLNLTNSTASQRYSSASSASSPPSALAAPAIFDPQQPRPLRGMQSIWKATQKTGRASAPSAPPRQDHFVRPASFEQPLSTQQKAPRSAPAVDSPGAVTGTASLMKPSVKTAAATPTTSARAITVEAGSSTARATPLAVLPDSDGLDKAGRAKRASSKRATPTSLPAPSKAQRKTVRNPMRDPELSREAVSVDNPLRERPSSGSGNRENSQRNLANPLR